MTISVSIRFDPPAAQPDAVMHLFAICDGEAFEEACKGSFAGSSDFVIGQMFSTTANSLAQSARLRKADLPAGENHVFEFELDPSCSSVEALYVWGAPDCSNSKLCQKTIKLIQDIGVRNLALSIVGSAIQIEEIQPKEAPSCA